MEEGCQEGLPFPLIALYHEAFFLNYASLCVLRFVHESGYYFCDVDVVFGCEVGAQVLVERE